ncbi:MAG: M23 family metallopeptidase [Congregibacter sp.]
MGRLDAASKQQIGTVKFERRSPIDRHVMLKRARSYSIASVLGGVLVFSQVAVEVANGAEPPRLQWPVPSYTRNSSLAPQDYAEFNDVLQTKHHTGLDIPAPHGSPVVAAHGGIVTALLLDAGGMDQKTKCLGNVVIVTHESGFSTLYAHLSSVSVATGDHIEDADAGMAGGRIGAVGGTAGKQSSGTNCDEVGNDPGDGLIATHLHFELKNHSGLGARVDSVDINAWGYVPEGQGASTAAFQPEQLGYRDPVQHLHPGVEEVVGDLVVTEAGNGLQTRHGPGVRYDRTAVLRSGESFEAIAFAFGDDEICPLGWYQIRNSDASYIADEIDIPDADGSVPETWVCAGNDAETWVKTDLPLFQGLSSTLIVAAMQKKKPADSRPSLNGLWEGTATAGSLVLGYRWSIIQEGQTVYGSISKRLPIAADWELPTLKQLFLSGELSLVEPASVRLDAGTSWDSMGVGLLAMSHTNPLWSTCVTSFMK